MKPGWEAHEVELRSAGNRSAGRHGEEAPCWMTHARQLVAVWAVRHAGAGRDPAWVVLPSDGQCGERQTEGTAEGGSGFVG